MTDLFSMDRFSVDKGGSEWSEQLEKFAERLNPSREKAGYKPMSYGQIGRKLNKVGIHNAEDAYILFRKCEDFNNFSKGFWYLTK